MPVVDLSFHLTGTVIPADHGYSLYGAVCRLIPDFHEHLSAEQENRGSSRTFGIHPINGTLVGNRKLQLNEKSRVIFRVTDQYIKPLLSLAGKTLNLDGCLISLGVPNPLLLKPSPHLRSRLVVIKGFMEPVEFLEAAQRQLTELGLKGTPTLTKRKSPKSVEGHNSRPDPDEAIKRTISIRDKTVVGFALEVAGLSDVDSISLQEQGIGGRRRFGCGIFTPTKA